MSRDPIVDEVRAIRERLAAALEFDIRRIVEDAQRRQLAFKDKLVSFERSQKAAKAGVPTEHGPVGER